MKKLFILLLTGIIAAGSLTAGGSQEKEEGPRTLTVKVWARGNDIEHWRVDAAVEAAKVLNDELKSEGSQVTVVVEPSNDGAGWADFKKKYALAASSGEAPDIICSGHEDIATWARAGYIMPLADSVSDIKSQSPEFSDVIDSLWNSSLWMGKVWGVPQDTEARPMFFSKTKLKALGWSESDIAALPGKIEAGSFTLSDMVALSKEAVAKGIVEKEYAYWHRPRKGGDFIQYYKAFGGELYDAGEDKLVISKKALEDFYSFQRECVDAGITPANYIGTEWKIWHDIVSNDKALFWNGGTWMWADWVKNYAKGGEAGLFERVGYALQPSGIRGQKGTTLSHPLVYLVSTEKASGNTDRDLVKRLLAKMTTKELNTLHALDSSHLAILKSQTTYADYKNSEFLADVTSLLDNNFYQPNHVMYGIWFDAVFDGMLAAEQGTKAPAEAAADAVKLLELELEDALIVR